MKKTSTTARRLALGTYLTVGLALSAAAQNTAPATGEMRLKVTERTGNDLREIDRVYRTEGMTDDKRDAIVNALIDSLRATRKGKDSQISVTVEDSRGSSETRFNNKPGQRTDRQRFNGRVFAVPAPPRPPRIGYVAPPGQDVDDDINIVIDTDSIQPGDRDTVREFRFNRRQMDSMGRDMRRMGQELRREMAPMADRLRRDMRPMLDRLNRMQGSFDDRLVAPFEAWATQGPSATVRGLDVYPSNPDKHLLNVRFNTPAKGAVLIVVTNPKGKEVARRDLPDFSGEFVGQVDLGRKAEGVFFVTVTQNDDGAVRRVALRKEEEAKK